MDIRNNNQKHSNTISVMVRTFKNGPWSPLNVEIILEDFIKAPSADEYIIGKASMSFMGSNDVEFDYKYTQAQAKEDLQLVQEFKASH